MDDDPHAPGPPTPRTPDAAAASPAPAPGTPPRGLVLTAQHPSGLPVPRPHRSPGLVRLRRGAYVNTEAWTGAHQSERHRLRVLAAADAALGDRVLSHESAAVMLGLPLVGAMPEKVHVVTRRRSGGRSTGLLVRHTVSTMPATVTVHGLRVTSPARTVVDLARTRALGSALASADHALARGLCTVDTLMAELGLVRGGRGTRAARYALERADPRAESPGESLSRARLHELGLELPELQEEFYDDDGFIGRVDFWWSARKTVGEFDGQAKYGADAVTSAEALWEEKRREDRLRALGLQVVRWTWPDVLDAVRFTRLLRRAGLT